MSKSNITPEKLAKVAEMVKAQKAKADADKAQRKSLVATKPVKPSKDGNDEQAAKAAARAERKVLRDQERAAKKAELEVKRAAKKAERDAAKTAKAVERVNRAPAWQRKIERLQAALPPSTPSLETLSATLQSFTDVELTSALAYVEYERRVRGIRATAELKANEGQALNVGDKVLIKNCTARKFIGQVGVVSLVRRIRAFVEVPDFDTQAYVFTSDVEVLEPVNAGEMGVNILDTSADAEADSTEESVESTGTEG